MIQNGVLHPCLSNLKAPSSHLGTLGTKDIVGGSEIMPDLAHLYQVSTWCWFTEREWRMKLTYAVCTKIRIQLPLPCDRSVAWVLIRMNAKCWGVQFDSEPKWVLSLSNQVFRKSFRTRIKIKRATTRHCSRIQQCDQMTKREMPTAWHFVFPNQHDERNHLFDQRDPQKRTLPFLWYG